MANKATEIMAENIKLYLNKNGKTPANLIADLGIKRSTVYNWLNGVSYPRIDKIELLADYFGITKADLVEDKAETNNKTTHQKSIDLQQYAVDDSERDEAINAGGVPISDEDWAIIKAVLSKYPRKDQ